MRRAEEEAGNGGGHSAYAGPEPARVFSRSDHFGKKRVKLALQGGGAFGAYATGILIQMLIDPKIEIVEISGTSAGEKLALIIADRINSAPSYDAGRMAAVDALFDFWERIVRESAPVMQALDMIHNPLQAGFLRPIFGRSGAAPSPNLPVLKDFARTQRTLSNLFDISARMVPWMPRFKDPLSYTSSAVATSALRNIIGEVVTHERDPRDPGDRIFTHAASSRFITVHINTAVETPCGRHENRVHTGQDLTLKRSMGSSALKGFFEASYINGEHHWDGGYAENTCISALLESPVRADGIVIVGTNRPSEPTITPRLQRDITVRELEKTMGLVWAHMYAEAVYHAERWKPGQPTLHLVTFNHDADLDWTAKQNTSEWHIRGLLRRGQSDGIAALTSMRPYLGVKPTIKRAALEAVARRSQKTAADDVPVAAPVRPFGKLQAA